MGLVIRPAEAGDLSAIARLEAKLFSTFRPEEQLKRELSNPLCRLWCAELDGSFAGYAGYTFVLDEGYMDNIAVIPSARRLGIGRALMKHLLAEGKAEDLAFLTLEVREGNTPARSLYESLGFEPVGRRKNYYENPKEDALLLTYTYHSGESLC